MASITKEIALDVPAEKAWDAVRDAGAVHRRLMPAYIVDTQLDGQVRSCTTADGAPMRELVIDIDDEARRLVYSIVDSPVSMMHHSASMQVFADDGKSTFVWISDFLPNELAGPFGELIEGVAANIAETLNQ